MRTYYNLRLALDALGTAIVFLLVAVSLGSLVLNIEYWGPAGFVLGRLFNRNDGGGIHTLAVLGVTLIMTKWARVSHINMIFAAIGAFLADYFHEGIWNIPYYIYYHAHIALLPLYVLMAAFCYLMFAVCVYGGRRPAPLQHNFRLILYLLPWFAIITLYVLTIHAYSEDLYGLQIYYKSIPVGAYEIGEVNLFAYSLYKGLTAKKDGTPVLSTAFGIPAPRPKTPKTGPTKHGFLATMFGNPTVVIIVLMLAGLLLVYHFAPWLL